MKIGVIGTGEIARLHAEALLREGGSFDAAYDVNAEALEGFCRDTGARAFPSAEALLADGSLDTVYLCTRHDSHVALAMAAVRAGKRVFLEKPLALHARDAEPLLALPGASERVFVGYNMRHTPTMRLLRQRMDERGAQAESFRANMTGAPFMEGWASDPAQGGGVLVCQGSHMFDLIANTLGSRVEAVMADTRRIRLPEDRCPDSATLLLRLENGVTGTLLLHDRGQYAYHVEPAGKMINLTVYAPQGTFGADAYGKLCWGDASDYREERPVEGIDRVRDWGYQEQARRLLHGGEGLCTLAQAAETAATVDAAGRSAREGAWIRVIYRNNRQEG